MFKININKQWRMPLRFSLDQFNPSFTVVRLILGRVSYFLETSIIHLL